MGSLSRAGQQRTCDSINTSTDNMRNIILTFLLHLLVAQGLFFDLLKKHQNKKNKISRRVGVSSSYNSSNNYYNDKRHKKKSDYVCSSDSFSEKVKKLYDCSTNIVEQSNIADNNNDLKTVTETVNRNSQPCY